MRRLAGGLWRVGRPGIRGVSHPRLPPKCLLPLARPGKSLQAHPLPGFALNPNCEGPKGGGTAARSLWGVRGALPGAARLWVTHSTSPTRSSPTPTPPSLAALLSLPARPSPTCNPCSISQRRRRTQSVDWEQPGPHPGDEAALVSTPVISAASSLLGHHLNAGLASAAPSGSLNASPTQAALQLARTHSVSKELYEVRGPGRGRVGPA